MTNEEAIRVFNVLKTTVKNQPSYVYEALDVAYKALKNERPHSKWIKNKLYGYKCLQCEKCGKADFNMRNYKFCPDCGADMRGNNNEKDNL